MERHAFRTYIRINIVNFYISCLIRYGIYQVTLFYVVRIINLNKYLNRMIYSYKYKLPELFLFAQPVSSIIGNASYSDGLVVFQNVTINTGDDTRGDSATPKLGRGLFLGAGAKIIGEKTIGDRVSIGVDAIVYNKQIDDDTVVLRDCDSGQIITRPRRNPKCMAQNYFDIEL